jgi:hypothetical protein
MTAINQFGLKPCCVHVCPARYDGQVFVKPPEVLTRDRLLGAYEVKPALQRLRGTLVGVGGALLVVSLTLAGLLRVDEVNEVGPTGECH